MIILINNPLFKRNLGLSYQPAEIHQKLPLTYQSRIEESEHFLQMQEVEGEPNADTLIELIEARGSWAKYRLTPGSGKKHQLRCHFNALHIPIKNDQIYPVLTPYQEYDLDFSKPLQLLAKEIIFEDPVTGTIQSFVSKNSLSLNPSVLQNC